MKARAESGTPSPLPARFHYCPHSGHQSQYECEAPATCTLPERIACPVCLTTLCTGRTNERARPRGYGAQL